MLFFAVTGALMLGVMGSASIGVNSQRYSDAVTTFSAIVQQEFTNVTNVVNTKSVQNMCAVGDDSETPRGISSCVIIGRLMTVDNQGAIVRSNLVGLDPGPLSPTATELEVVRAYMGTGRAIIDVASKEEDTMSWDTRLERGNPLATSQASILILRSPRSGNVYSYVLHSAAGVITNDAELRDRVDDELIGANPAPNSQDQYLCVDRSGWVATSAQAIRITPFASGPSGVGVVNVEGTICA